MISEYFSHISLFIFICCAAACFIMHGKSRAGIAGGVIFLALSSIHLAYLAIESLLSADFPDVPDSWYETLTNAEMLIYAAIFFTILFLPRAASKKIAGQTQVKLDTQVKINTQVYLGIMILNLCFNPFVIRFLIMDIGVNPFMVVGATLCLGIATLILFMRLIYISWSAIQDGHARTTPGKAMWLMLIPFFNLYWAYVAWVGLAQDINSYIKRNELEVTPLQPGLFGLVVYLGFVISLLTRTPPPVGMIASLAALVMNILAIKVVYDLCQTVNALPQSAENTELEAAD